MAQHSDKGKIYTKHCGSAVEMRVLRWMNAFALINHCGTQFSFGYIASLLNGSSLNEALITAMPALRNVILKLWESNSIEYILSHQAGLLVMWIAYRFSLNIGGSASCRHKS